MEFPSNGTIEYKGREYILKNGIDKDSAITLLGACERSGHLSEMMFYKVWKLLARNGMSVNDACGMSNQTLFNISHTNSCGAATIEVLFELQVTDRPHEPINDTIDRLMNEGDSMQADDIFTPVDSDKPAYHESQKQDTQKEKPSVKTDTTNELTVTYNGMTVRLKSENNFGNIVVELRNANETSKRIA